MLDDTLYLSNALASFELHSVRTPLLEKNRKEKDINEKKLYLFELVERGVFSNQVAYETLYKYDQYLRQRQSSKLSNKIDHVALLAFSLFDTLCEMSLSRNPKEIVDFFNISVHRFWEEEKKLGFLTQRKINVTDFIERFCNILHMEYSHFIQIRNIYDEMYGMGDLNPQSIAACIIFTYCQYFDPFIKLKDICRILNIPYGSINSILTGKKLKNYIVNIIRNLNCTNRNKSLFKSDSELPLNNKKGKEEKRLEKGKENNNHVCGSSSTYRNQ